jgi:hypothetical protein
MTFHYQLQGADLHDAKAKVGSGSPVGVVTPDVVGLLYYDTPGNGLWASIGLTNVDWVLLVSSGLNVGTLIRPYTAGVLLRDVVYQKADGSVDRADASAVATGIAVGVVQMMDFPAVGQCVIRFAGDVTGFSGLVPGSIYLIATNPGGIVEETDTGNVNYPDVTPGSGNVIAEVGIAGSATTLFVGTMRDFEEQ